LTVATFEESWEGPDEEAFVESVCKLYRGAYPNAFIEKNVRLSKGSVDISIESPERELTLIECKLGGGINEIAHALGQLLFYREQFDATSFKKISCEIYCHDNIDKETFLFAKWLCARYDVMLSSMPNVIRAWEED
jgi:hypothetical protein